MRRVLILEDNVERRTALERAASSLGLEPKVWKDAHTMQAECEIFFPEAALISLEHDLDHGTGLEVAKFLAARQPVCPVIVHSANTDRSFSMCNELRFADWKVDRVGPIGEKWADKYWAKMAREFLDLSATAA
jgi:CheY-like chemotaxis protein